MPGPRAAPVAASTRLTFAFLLARPHASYDEPVIHTASAAAGSADQLMSWQPYSASPPMRAYASRRQSHLNAWPFADLFAETPTRSVSSSQFLSAHACTALAGAS